MVPLSSPFKSCASPRITCRCSGLAARALIPGTVRRRRAVAVVGKSQIESLSQISKLPRNGLKFFSQNLKSPFFVEISSLYTPWVKKQDTKVVST